VITGSSLSLTVTVNEQLAVRPAPSVTVQSTVVVPFGKAVPDEGVQTTAPEGSGQLSAVVGLNVTTAEHWPGSVPCVMFAGHVIVGGWSSVIVTVNVQV
jgi:hypothetical protein